MFDLMKLARMGLIAFGAIAAWGAWLWNHDIKVVNKDRARVTKANENAAKNGARAADKSRSGGVQAGARRDPLTRD